MTRTKAEVEAELEQAMQRMNAAGEALAISFTKVKDGEWAYNAPEVKAANKEADIATKEVRRLMKEAKGLGRS